MASTSQQLQFGRQCSLVVYNPATFSQAPTTSAATGSRTEMQQPGSVQPPGTGIDLSQMHIVFRTSQGDIETPNTARIRVYNLKQETAKAVTGEFTRVTLGASYQGQKPQTIFDGTIKQVLAGFEDAVSSYVEIFAADGDIPYNNAVITRAFPAGSTQQDEWGAVAQSMGLPQGYTMDMTPGAASRGKVMWGMARDYARDIATTQNASWSIQNGELVLISNTSYIPGEAVVLNSQTGLIGFPTQTPNGIQIRCLLNPKIKIGRLVQINNKEVQQGIVNAPPAALFGSGRLESLAGYIPKIGLQADGLYKALVIEHQGDTRGEQWYSDLTCFAVDPAAPGGSSVRPYWASGPY